MIKIAICDNEKSTIKQIEDLIHIFFMNREEEYSIHSFSQSKDFIKEDVSCYNIVFLDIEIDELSGLDIAEIIRKKNEETIIIFISQFAEYTTSGYYVNAFRYILKPTIASFFERDLNSAIKKLYTKKEIFSYKFRNEYITLFTDDIIYFESNASKIIIHTIDPSESYIFYDKLNNIAERLTSNFIRVQQGLLINIKYISRISSYKVYLTTGEQFNTIREKQQYNLLKEKYAKIKKGCEN